ncbi:HAD family hydrolase [Desulfurococcaceae archaeon MEX13E-LK6-19]|nr:HAD family hydrolase [Desulfurococcaceae archaeon MEX13E-LK6-19]
MVHKLKLAILDYDMTLVDSLFDFFNAINSARAYFGAQPLSLSEFIDAFMKDTLQEYAVPQKAVEEDFWRVFRRIYETRYGYPAKGAHQLLYFLKTIGCKNIIVTGRESPEEKIWNELRRFNLDWGIDEIYTLYTLWKLEGVEEYLFDKSWLIKYILDKHCVEPCEAVMLGDYWIDALSSMKVGVPFIGVMLYPLRKSILTKKGVKYVVENLYDAILVLKEIKC